MKTVNKSTSERIQKVLARQGYGSRREIEHWVKAGRIKLNHKIANLGDKVCFKDTLLLDDKLIPINRASSAVTEIILYHKPQGEVSARRDDKFPTVFENLPPCQNGRWVMVGRLDVSTSGLLLFTNDGELANRLMHPSNEIPRKYLVRVHGLLTPEKCQNLQSGVQLSDGIAKFEKMILLPKKGTNQWVQVVLKEGRNREVKRLFETQGCDVTRLIRIAFGKVNLPRDLAPGSWRALDLNLNKQAFSDLL